MGAPRLQLLARALGVPALQVAWRSGCSRWHGLAGLEGPLLLDPRADARVARLQLLRHVLDGRADGRLALRFDRVADAGWVGPLAPRGPAPLDLAALLQSWPHPRLLARLFRRLDGQRVDGLLAAAFPGARADLVLDPPPGGDDGDGDGTAAADARQALAMALDRYRRLLAGRSPRRVRTLAPPALCVDNPGAPVRPWPGWRATAPGPAPPDPRDDAAPVPEADTPAGGEPGAAPPGRSRPHAADTGPRAGTAAHPGGERRAPAVRAAAVTRHPEWDFRLGRYRAQWVAVHERTPEAGPAAAPPTDDERRQQARRRLRRRLEAAAADAPRRLRAQDDGYAVDLDAALDAWVGRRAGPGPSRSGLYLAAPRRARELAVALLIDASASTDHVLKRLPPAGVAPLDDDEPLWQLLPLPPLPAAPPRRVIDVFKDAAALLAEVLEAQGDRSALYAFSGDGRAFVDFVGLKRFDEPWSARTRATLAALRPLGSTRTGAAVRHATLHLRHTDARRRVLIVLSDGYPQDSDYGRDADDLDHGLADTARALREAESAGIGVLNVSVDAAAHDYLRRICPRQRYLVMRDVESLPDRLVHWWRRITRASR